MKSERRHELRENDLVHALNVAKDYLDKNGGKIALVVVVLVVVIGGGTLFKRSRARAMEEVWQQRSNLKYTDPETGRKSLEVLRELTQGVTDRTFVMDSLMDQGRQALNLAQMVPNPPGKDFNDMARQAYTELLAKYPDNPMAIGVAKLGLATVEENAYVLDHDMAHKAKTRELLTEIIKDNRLTGLPVQTIATKRRAALDDTFTPITLVPTPDEPKSPDGNAADAKPAAPAANAAAAKPAKPNEDSDADTP